MEKCYTIREFNIASLNFWQWLRWLEFEKTYKHKSHSSCFCITYFINSKQFLNN